MHGFYLCSDTPLFHWGGVYALYFVTVYAMIEFFRYFLVVFDISDKFHFEARFCFSNCISAYPHNALVLTWT